MGWWKCNENGGIDWENKPTGHPGEDTFINAFPKRDSKEDYYNGDAPADFMYIPTAILKSWFINREPKPTTQQLIKLFTEKVFDPIFRHIEQKKLNNLIDATWKGIDAIYQETWGRPTYPQERFYVCSFSFGGADRVKTDWKDWWKIHDNDKKYIKDYETGWWPVE